MRWYEAGAAAYDDNHLDGLLLLHSRSPRRMHFLKRRQRAAAHSSSGSVISFTANMSLLGLTSDSIAAASSTC
jgi:hypothetical protein